MLLRQFEKYKVPIFCVYVLIMFYLLFIGRSGHPHGIYSINLIPFSTIWVYLSQNHIPLQIKVINLLGKILVFLPLGVFIAQYINTIMYRLWLAIGIPLFIELVQVMTFTGVGDIDDILLNALGVAIGYYCFAYFNHAFNQSE